MTTTSDNDTLGNDLDTTPRTTGFLTQLSTSAEWFSIREVNNTSVWFTSRKGVVETCSSTEDIGAMVEARVQGFHAYAATSDLTRSGIQLALDRATAIATTL